MFYTENIKKCLALMDRLEQKAPCFSGEVRQDICRIALHTEDYKTVEKLVLQLSAPQAKAENYRNLRDDYLKMVPDALEGSALQIQDYIIQLQTMSYEKDKTNAILAELLQRHNIQYDLDAVIEQLQRESRYQNREAVR